MKEIFTLIADNQPMYVYGMKCALTKEVNAGTFIIEHTADDLSTLMSLKDKRVDLLLLDPNMKGIENPQKILDLRVAFPKAAILILSNFNNPKVVKSMLRAGADGYLLKTCTYQELLFAIEKVMEGKTFTGKDVILAGKARGVAGAEQAEEEKFAQKYALTRREMEILMFIGQALNNREIAERLYISDQTVSVHRKNIMRKIGVRSTANLIKLTYDYSLI
jgi:DNA-binding NarL/FixJ family response regulator